METQRTEKVSQVESVDKRFPRRWTVKHWGPLYSKGNCPQNEKKQYTEWEENVCKFIHSTKDWYREYARN
jgi:hypothetical protein